MDTPLAAVVHKENVHIGAGKATVKTKLDKLKTAKTDGKVREALAVLRSTYLPVEGASKDVDLKQKSIAKGNKVKKNQMTQGNFGTTKKHPVTGPLQGANLNRRSVLEGNFGKGNKPFDDILTDDEIRRCHEWAKDGIEGMGCLSWSAKDEANFFMKQTISEIMASAIGVPISELEEPFTSEEEGYETDESDFKISVPGCISSVLTPEKLDDPFGVAGLWLEEYYPLPELKLNDDYEEFSIGSDGRNNGTEPFDTVRASI